jgi:ParB family chromosome partitioning protein
MSPSKRRGLGRGLDALLTATPNENSDKQSIDANTDEMVVASQSGELQVLALNLLQPGKYQPRKDMSADALEELSASIRSQGVIQPIVVRSLPNGSYEIIAGERRWRAAKLAGLTDIPCLIKNVPDEAAVAIALIENIQREDLNAMEEAIALDQLMKEFELTHQEVADAVGKSRAAVSNLLRLNKLHSDVKTLLEHGDIEMGHARALLALDDEVQHEIAKIVTVKELTVRETEMLVKKTLTPEKEKIEKTPDPSTDELAKNISEKLGSQVAISHNKKGRGKMVISYTTLDELDAIVARFRSF